MWWIDKEGFRKLPVDLFVLEFGWLEEFADDTAVRLTYHKTVSLLLNNFVLDQYLGLDGKKPGVQSYDLSNFVDIVFGNL